MFIFIALLPKAIFSLYTIEMHLIIFFAYLLHGHASKYSPYSANVCAILPLDWRQRGNVVLFGLMALKLGSMPHSVYESEWLLLIGRLQAPKTGCEPNQAPHPHQTSAKNSKLFCILLTLIARRRLCLFL